MLIMAIEAKTGATAMYAGGIKNAHMERMARLIKIVGMVYMRSFTCFEKSNFAKNKKEREASRVCCFYGLMC